MKGRRALLTALFLCGCGAEAPSDTFPADEDAAEGEVDARRGGAGGAIADGSVGGPTEDGATADGPRDDLAGRFDGPGDSFIREAGSDGRGDAVDGATVDGR